MRWRQVVVLYLVCGGLAVTYARLARQPRPPASERPARRRFLAVGPEEVRELRMQRGGRTVVSRRDGERWIVVEPADAAIPPDLIAAFTNALAGAEEIDVVSGSASDPHAYGLDEQAARVELVLGRGLPVVVTIGGTNPTGTAVYARGDRAAAVVLIGRNVRYYEDLIFQSLPAPRAPAVEQGIPVGG